MEISTIGKMFGVSPVAFPQRGLLISQALAWIALKILLAIL